MAQHWLSKPPPGNFPSPGWIQDFGCVGLWLMNEGGGGKIYDVSGNRNDGTLTGDVTWTGGKFGSALSFDGVNDYVNAGSSSILNPTTAITVSAWIKSTSPSSGDTILSRWYSSTPASNRSYWLGIADITGLKFRFSLNGNDYYIEGFLPVVNTWYHITGTFDSSGINLYVNGVSTGTITGIKPASINSNSSNTSIGMEQGGIGNLIRGYFDGSLDDVRIYNKALPESEIKRQFAQPFYMIPKRSPIFYSISAGGTTYEVSLSLGGIGGITQTNIATLNNSVEVAGVSGMTDTNIATLLQSLSLAGIGGITEEQIVTILGNIAIEAKSGITESNIATLLNAVSLDSVGDISQTDMLTILGLLSLNGISDISQINIGTLLNGLSLDATAGITESNIATLLNTLNLDSVDGITLTNIATLYNALGFTSIGDILFPFGDIYDVSLSLDAVSNIANVQSYIVVSSVSFTASGAMTITNIATLQNSLTLSQIATLATWGVLTSEKLRIIAVTAKALYCIGVDTKQLYEISVESK